MTPPTPPPPPRVTPDVALRRVLAMLPERARRQLEAEIYVLEARVGLRTRRGEFWRDPVRAAQARAKIAATVARRARSPEVALCWRATGTEELLSFADAAARLGLRVATLRNRVSLGRGLAHVTGAEDVATVRRLAPAERRALAT